MNYRTVLVLLIILNFCSCTRLPSKRASQEDKIPDHGISLKSGLLFEAGGKRGTEFTDSLGTEYSLRYLPIFITNDSTIPIHIQLAFLEEYEYSVDYGQGKFKVIPLPKEWGHEGTTDSMFDNMLNKLPSYINKPLINETIKPGEKIVIGIGTILVVPRDVSINIGVPFAHFEEGVFPTCIWQMNEEPTASQEIALGLKLDINEICMVIPCGHISYPEN